MITGPEPQNWTWSELFLRVCVLALADKLMEETEELCLQREQREVGYTEAAAHRLPLGGRFTSLLGVSWLVFLARGMVEGRWAPGPLAGKSDVQSEEAHERTVLATCCGF